MGGGRKEGPRGEGIEGKKGGIEELRKVRGGIETALWRNLVGRHWAWEWEKGGIRRGERRNRE